MRKSFTLIYFVNQFQPGKSNINPVEKSNKEDRSALSTPSDRTIETILNFARAYEVLKTNNAGQVEMILN